MGEFKIINHSKNAIMCFSGFGFKFGGIRPFEFLNHLSDVYGKDVDLYFFIDKYQCWYHKGFNNEQIIDIDHTVEHLNNIIKDGRYEKVIFMGTSAGGYASILFGSLCNVANVLAFVPQTILKDDHCINKKYKNLNLFINKKTKYVLYANGNVTNRNGHHHVSHCNNIKNNSNVKIKINPHGVVMKDLRDNGTIKMELDKMLNSQ